MTDKHQAKNQDQEKQPEHTLENPTTEQSSKPNIFQVIFSVLAALFGVQSAKNRERDFQRGDAKDYIGVYVILVVTLVIGMIILVKVVLSSAGS